MWPPDLSVVQALDAVSGKLLWRYDPKLTAIAEEIAPLVGNPWTRDFGKAESMWVLKTDDSLH